MKLHYRGIVHERTQTTFAVTEGETKGKFRGQYWNSRRLAKQPTLQQHEKLTYRGVAY